MFLFQTPDPLGGTFTNAHEVRLVGVFVPVFPQCFEVPLEGTPSGSPFPGGRASSGLGQSLDLVTEEGGERLGQLALDVAVLEDQDLLEERLVELSADDVRGVEVGGLEISAQIEGAAQGPVGCLGRGVPLRAFTDGCARLTSNSGPTDGAIPPRRSHTPEAMLPGWSARRRAGGARASRCLELLP